MLLSPEEHFENVKNIIFDEKFHCFQTVDVEICLILKLIQGLEIL